MVMPIVLQERRHDRALCSCGIKFEAYFEDSEQSRRHVLDGWLLREYGDGVCGLDIRYDVCGDGDYLCRQVSEVAIPHVEKATAMNSSGNSGATGSSRLIDPHILLRFKLFKKRCSLLL